MKTVAVCPNPLRDEELSQTRSLCELLTEAGLKSIVYPLDEAETHELLSKKLDGADAAVALGGDGTMLHVARAAALADIPVLGINLGNLGYMTELERGELTEAVRALSGNTPVELRMMLDVRVMRAGREVFADIALNEAAVRGITRTVKVETRADGVLLGVFSGDGVICATPTGSTAYSLSAGGPIVEPGARNILITPLNAHDLSARSMVLSPERRVELVTPRASGKLVYLSVDGSEPFYMENGDTVVITASKGNVKLFMLGQMSFYDKVRRKLGGQL